MDPEITTAIVTFVAEESAKVGAKALYRKCKHLVYRNDRLVELEMTRQDEELARLSEEVKAAHDYSEVAVEEQPDGVAFMNAVKDYAQAYEQTFDTKHREMLYRAFFKRFDPKHYTEGRSKILWDYAVQLHYPDALYLRRLIAKADEDFERVKNQQTAAERKVRMAVAWQSRGTIDYDSARRLERIGLVEVDRPTSDPNTAQVRVVYDLVTQLMDFVLEDPRAPKSIGGAGKPG